MSAYHPISFYSEKYDIPLQTIYTWIRIGVRGIRLAVYEIGGIIRINESTWDKFQQQTKRRKREVAA